MERYYAAIDLKSFYASAECVDRGLDPLTTNLVVADASRTDKTICLAVSPGLKKYGIPGRPRLFEVREAVKRINAERALKAKSRRLTGKSSDAAELEKDPSLALDFIIAVPRMNYYMNMSGRIYQIYLRYIAPEDIHVYSIDEVFIDLTSYLKTYSAGPRELTVKLIREVFMETGITATAGIGTNMYLAKVAMDIEAKHSPPDENGVRIAELDEFSYRRKLWGHRPLTDFWRVGHGYAKTLAEKGLYTMGDIAKCSLGGKGQYYSEDLLYKLFGVNAELLIDHAWGWEPCTIADIKAYRSAGSSISSGQVLKTPYAYEDAKLIVREMADSLALELVEKGLLTDQITLSLHYDSENLSGSDYQGAVKKDHYGRAVPKPAHGSASLGGFTSSGKKIANAAAGLYEQIADRELTIRHIYVVLNHTVSWAEAQSAREELQPSLFPAEPIPGESAGSAEKEDKELDLQRSILRIQKKYGKNAVLKGMSLQDQATQKERNEQVGGHRS